MHELLSAIADIVRDGGWLSLVLLAALLGGLGQRISYILSGRSKLAAKSAETKALQQENARLHALLLKTTDHRALTGTIEHGDVAQLATQASEAIDDRARMLYLLGQVQATDRALPQLPQELRDQIDDAVAEQHDRSRTNIDTRQP